MTTPTTGIHVQCIYGGLPVGGSITGAANIVPLLTVGFSPWSETLTAGSTSTQTAPNGGANSGPPVFSIHAFGDCWISIGQNPNASTAVSTSRDNARRFLAAGSDLDIGVAFGDKIAVAAT